MPESSFKERLLNTFNFLSKNKPAKEKSSSPTIPEWAVKEKTIVACRDYESVLNGLKIPDDYFVEGEKVLSVGEGFSNFSKKLHEEKSVDSIAIDPIYEIHGKTIKNEDGTEEKINIFQSDPKKIAESLYKFYGHSVRFDDIRGEGTFEFPNGEEIPLLDPERSIAASVYKLPFPDNHFDKIVSYRVFEHIDFSKALPELLRVIKEGGEIRMAGLCLSVFPSKKKLTATIWEPSLDGMYLETFHHLEVEKSFDSMIENDSISSYIFVDDYFTTKINRNLPDIRRGSALIIRKDNQWPKTNKTESTDPYLGKIMKVLKEKPEEDMEIKQDCYKLSSKDSV